MKSAAPDADIPATMQAMILTGHGGVERLEWRTDWPVPRPRRGEVLVRVTACGKNNTDRKVREGLYSTRDDDRVASFAMAGDTLRFPRIQGADVVGRVAAVGEGVDPARFGQRGLLDFNIYPDDRRDMNLATDYYGHGADGGFAEYGVFPADQFHVVPNATLADAELATLGMCAWQTALHMLEAVDVKAGEQVLVTGASGGVGAALLQLCRLLGAVPHAVASAGKEEALRALGAASVIERTRPEELPAAVDAATGGARIDAVMDLVGGAFTPRLVEVMCRDVRARPTPPRLAIAGASSGAVTRLPWSLVYLNQVRIFGVSQGTRDQAERLVTWIREDRLRPILAGTMRLSQLREAEERFVARGSSFLGKLVIVPDSQWEAHGAAFALPEG